MTKEQMKEQKIMQADLDEWYRQNPDDAGEHEVDDIVLRFPGCSREMAEAMYRRIQKDRYGGAAQ